MSLWRRLFGRAPAPAGDAPLDAGEPGADDESAGDVDDAPETVAPPALRLLRALGEAGRRQRPAAGTDDEAPLAALASLVGGPAEHAALEAVVRAAAAHKAPAALCVEAAKIALARGEAIRARSLLAASPAASPGAHAGETLLRADVEALAGDLAAACALAERVLARDYDAPGARERLTRWRASLGLTPPPAAALESVTVMVAQPEVRAPFRLVAEAGRGGAAVVFEADDETLGRRVALKVYHRPREQRDQIAREARVAVAVAGPGVVRVYDAEIDAGWVALEWAGGGTLRDALARARPGAEPAGAWLVALVDALARVHRAGWVHGDVKPANVLLRAGAGALLSDFGLARRPGERWSGGSLGYLSPERLAGGSAAFTDDVYGVGRVVEDSLLAGAEGLLADLARDCLGPLAGRPGDASRLAEHPALAALRRAGA